MAQGPGSGEGTVAGRRATAPTHRPAWLLVLSSITLVYGGLLLVSGLTALRNPVAAARFPTARPLAPEEEAIARELIAINAEIVGRHVVGIRGRAAASTVLALLMLYSAAAALSRDRHGRAANLLAAWLGIAYQLGSLPLVIPIANDYAAASGPILTRMMVPDPAAAPPDAGSNGVTADAGVAAADAGAAVNPGGATAAPSGVATTPTPPAEPPPRPEALAQFMNTVFLGIPIATALFGVLGSLLIIRYFGGRRGRILYGLQSPPPRR